MKKQDDDLYSRKEWTITKTYLALFVLMLFYAAASFGD